VSSRRTLILIAAIVIGALAAYAVVTYVGGIEDRANDNARRVPVVRISGDIPRGMRGSEAQEAGLLDLDAEIAAEFVPDNYIPPDAVETVLTKAAVSDLATGQVLVDNMFVNPADSQITAARRIAEGNVAITVSVDEVRGVAGLIVPGDFVNLMVAQDNDCGGQAEGEGGTGAPAGTTGILCRTARMMFQEVQVLFIDTNPVQQPGEATTTDEDGAVVEPVNTGLITLQVPPAAAQLIASVQPDGFYLSLLPPTYTPVPLPQIDPNVVLLPGEDGGQLTPYGPSGFSEDETP
jgi:pilus assembly protein CpaB